MKKEIDCPDCAMLLRVQEHLALPSMEELEGAVPEDLLATVWPGVEGGLEEGRATGSEGVSAETPSHSRATPSRSGETHSRPGLTWLIPTLAAASLVLLFSTGFLFWNLRQAQTRSTELAAEIGDLRRDMAELDSRTEWIQRTAQLAGNRRNRARALDYVLAGQESITVGGLVELLERYPANMVLFDASRVEELAGTSLRPPPELREILAVVAEALTSLGDAREVKAGDLAQWLATSGLPPDMVVPKSPLMDLLS